MDRLSVPERSGSLVVALAAIAVGSCGWSRADNTAQVEQTPPAVEGTAAALPTGGSPFFLEPGPRATSSVNGAVSTPTVGGAHNPARQGQGELLGSGPTPVSPPTLDHSRPPAVVDGVVVTWDELHRARSRPEGGETLESLVNILLVEHEAKRRGATASNEEIEREVARDREALPRGLTDEEGAARYGYTHYD